MSNKQDLFRLVEERGYTERDLFEAEELEEIAEFLEEKTGVVWRDE